MNHEPTCTCARCHWARKVAEEKRWLAQCVRRSPDDPGTARLHAAVRAAEPEEPERFDECTGPMEVEP
jgi:hypothetical protein